METYSESHRMPHVVKQMPRLGEKSSLAWKSKPEPILPTHNCEKTMAMRSFLSLSEQEILALAISLEEEDARLYDDFAEGLRNDYPATADTLKEMRAEEDGHRHRLLSLYRQKFGEHIPLIRRHDVKGIWYNEDQSGFGAAAGAGCSPQEHRGNGAGNQALLREGRPAGQRRRRPPTTRRPGRGRAQASKAG